MRPLKSKPKRVRPEIRGFFHNATPNLEPETWNLERSKANQR